MLKNNNLMKSNLIYCLKCPVTNDIRYIGQTRRGIRRKYEHLSKLKKKYNSNTYLYNWINDLFSKGVKPIFEIVESFEDSSLLNEREIYWISFYSKKYNLCNYELGGVSGKLISDNHNSKFLKGKKLEDYYGKEKSQEIRNKISLSTSGENNPSYGSKNINDEYIKKQVISNSKKKIIVTDIETNIEFTFINSKEASIFIGCCNSTIREGKRNNHLIKSKYRVKDAEK